MPVRRQPERAIQRQVVHLLQHVGCRVWVLGTTRRRGDWHGTMMSPGLPDCIAMLPRALGVLFVEVKAPNGRLRPEQREFRDLCLQQLRAGRGIYHVTGGLDSVIVLLVHLGLLKPDNLPAHRWPKEDA